MPDVQLQVYDEDINDAVLAYKNNTIAATRSQVNVADLVDQSLTNLQLVAAKVDADQVRITNAENQYEIIQYFASIPSGTSGALTIPTGYTIELDRFGDSIDAIILKQGNDGKPIDDVVKSASGSIITTTLNSGGNYTLSGTPSVYPICLVYYLRGQVKQRANLALNNVVITNTAVGLNRGVAVFVQSTSPVDGQQNDIWIKV